MEEKVFTVVGGDRRSIELARMLRGKGNIVKCFGFANYLNYENGLCKNLYEAVDSADFIIGPIPCSHNGDALNAPFHNAPIYAEDLFRLIKPCQRFIAGVIQPELLERAAKYNIHVIDLFNREELLIRNAIPTAEGAIKIAIEETDITLHGNNMLVIGYGRIGKALCRILRGMGAVVTAVVNSSESKAQAESCGHHAVFGINNDLKYADIIFNTVPKILLNRENMHLVKKGTLLIDLASPPYGIDVNDSRDFGLKVLYTNSLPGKIAPITTACYIMDTIGQVLAEMSGISEMEENRET